MGSDDYSERSRACRWAWANTHQHDNNPVAGTWRGPHGETEALDPAGVLDALALLRLEIQRLEARVAELEAKR